MECLGETVKIDTIRGGGMCTPLEPEIACTFSGLWMTNIIMIIHFAYLYCYVIKVNEFKYIDPLTDPL